MKEEIENEYTRMVTNGILEYLDSKDLLEREKVITATWAARRFEQIAGKHFDSTLTAAPVTTDTTIRIVLVLMLLAN